MSESSSDLINKFFGFSGHEVKATPPIIITKEAVSCAQCGSPNIQGDVCLSCGTKYEAPTVVMPQAMEPQQTPSKWAPGGKMHAMLGAALATDAILDAQEREEEERRRAQLLATPLVTQAKPNVSATETGNNASRCPNCGDVISPEANFCGHCQYKLK